MLGCPSAAAASVAAASVAVRFLINSEKGTKNKNELKTNKKNYSVRVEGCSFRNETIRQKDGVPWQRDNHSNGIAQTNNQSTPKCFEPNAFRFD